MENPFKIIDARLRSIENMLLEIRYPSLAPENRADKPVPAPDTTKEKSGNKDNNNKGGKDEK